MYNSTKHPYTKALMQEVPIPDPDIEKDKTLDLLEGDLPSPIHPPSGCVFRMRCKEVTEKCAQEKPGLKGETHLTACLLV